MKKNYPHDHSKTINKNAMPFNTKAGISLVVIISNLAFAAALFPSVSPIPLRSTDAQLMGFGVSIVAILLLMMTNPRKLTFVIEDKILLVLAVIYLLYVDWIFIFSDTELWLRRCGGFLVGWPVYYTTRVLYPYVSGRVLLTVAALYLISFVFQSISPDTANEILLNVLPTTRYEGGALEDLGSRGAHGLALEPSMLSIIMLTLIMSTYFLHPGRWKKNILARRALFAMCLTLLILNLSATGYIASVILWLLIITFSSKPTHKVRLMLLTGVLVPISFGMLVAVGYGVINISNIEKSRGVNLILSALEDPRYILEDESLMRRQIGTFLTVAGLSDYPVGDGRLEMSDERLQDAWQNDAVKALLPSNTAGIYEYSAGGKMVSPFGQGIHRMGVVYLIILGVLLYQVRGFRQAVAAQALLLISMIIFSVATSLIWYILGCCVALRYRNRYKKSIIDCYAASSGECATTKGI